MTQASPRFTAFAARYARPACAALLILLQTVSAQAQRTPPERPHSPPQLAYTLSFPQPHTHLYEVSLRISNVTTTHLDLMLPVWTPGSYLQREYARHVQDFAAQSDTGQALRWEKSDKATWRIVTGIRDGRARDLQVSYRVYANELRTQTSHLDASHAYFNGATLFMYLRESKQQPHRLKIIAPAGWRVTTPLALAPDADGWYTAPDYDVLVDSPTEIGTHRLIEFTVRDKPHRVAVWGEFVLDETRLKNDLAKIVEQGALVFGGLPYEHYTFIVHVQPGLGGGTEHLNSNVSMARPDALRTERGYKQFLALESHEYFHLWNVKRIRPFALGPFDYQGENYTSALWVSEGITSYYGDLLLRRAGLISVNEYLEGLTRMISGYEQTPGRLRQSAAAASFDAWIKYYRQDENTVNTAISYYTKGEILGLMLDLEIRLRTGNARSLDDVMRLLLEEHGLPRPGFTDAELKAAFERVAGTDLTAFFNDYVDGTAEIDFARYFELAGLKLEKINLPSQYLKQDEKPGWFGFRTRTSGDRVIVSQVLEGTPAYQGGINTGDEIVALDATKVDGENIGTHLARLSAGQQARLTLFRYDKLTTVDLTAVEKPPDFYRLTRMKEMSAQQRALYQSWLREELKPQP